MVLKILRAAAIIVVVLVLDAGVVFCEFAGSRWALPWIQKGVIPIIIAIPVLALLAIIRPLRIVSAYGFVLCAAFLVVSILTSAFVVEADLGGVFGIVAALLSGGMIVPPLVVLTMIVQAQWVPLLGFVAEFATLIFVMFLASTCTRTRR